MAKILIIEDDINTNEAVSEYMKALGHITFSAFDGENGINIAKGNVIDLIILDIMLPKINGIDVLKELRRTSTTPVLMLTAVDNEYMQVTSFDAEVDDYVTKPFSMVLLGKRVTALLRRSGNSSEVSKLQIGDINVDFDGYSVWENNKKIEVTPKEIELLKFLVEHKGLVLTRSQILDELWGYDSFVIDRTIDTYIKNLRKKLNLDCIVTVKGVGYNYEEKL